MSPNAHQLVASCFVMVLLVVAVATKLLFSRVHEMQSKRIHPQAIATSAGMAARFDDLRTADNFRNLFEVPVLFYALVALALAVSYTPRWLVVCAWVYVALRIVHSFIHCTYNKVNHRFMVFALSLLLLVVMWTVFFITLPTIA
jgi:hypothetical protein